MKHDPWIQRWGAQVQHALQGFFSPPEASTYPLEEAMSYSLLAGGKRLRPLLTIMVCEACGGNPADALPMALSTELLHTYSLIHDDLPAMDDDALRRGKPTCHVKFGEGQAILAGDGLQAEAFFILASTPVPGLTPQARIRVIREFSEAVGRLGMVGGQAMDLAMEGNPIDAEALTLLHRRKTGALIVFCVRLGGHLANATEPVMAGLTRYAQSLGLLFQVVDDLLDVESSSEILGKTAGKDADQDKATFPRLMGVEKTHHYADQLQQEARSALENLPIQSELLVKMAEYFRSRER